MSVTQTTEDVREHVYTQHTKSTDANVAQDLYFMKIDINVLVSAIGIITYCKIACSMSSDHRLELSIYVMVMI